MKKFARQRTLIFLLAIISVAATSLSPTFAANYTLSLALRQSPSVNNSLLTLYGAVRPARKNLTVSLEVKFAKHWKSTSFSAKTSPSGTWKVEATATALKARVEYRAYFQLNGKRIYSPTRPILIRQIPEISQADPTALISLTGPGGRIHGMDISRWQHPNDELIDFAKMYSRGIRFVMIKGADTHDRADAQALKYSLLDRNAAQAAGIYTGFYYYAYLPDTTDPVEIIRDANAQAQKAIWRLATLGGYTKRDLPLALDLENNCVRIGNTGKCSKYAARSDVTLWATTWLAAVAKKTGRLPFFYSYPNFLETALPAGFW